MRERWQFEPVYEGDGTPLVLLHGLTATWHTWNPLLPLLEREHQLLAPTLPGRAGGPLSGVGHVPMADAPELVASTILGVTRVAERRTNPAGT